ncbi:MAG TPA: ATP-binding cassette domain-containing protein [Puia sp.]|jgi:ABC-2 type transport system ATP-binding protein|nr:ATP-binding cassette domain-containing protein [Puia sp.]
MKITLIDAGKRFNRDWIFRHLNYEFSTGHSYAITGPNGSGKSTLLQSIAGAIGISQGLIRYEAAGPIPPDQAYRYLSLSAPYLQAIEEMTVSEFLDFHAVFKPFLPGLAIPDIIRVIGLESAMDKQIRFYSSGMKQRVRLAQALFSDTQVVLLDEPCTNLDSEGIGLYRRLIHGYAAGRLLIVSSNDTQEYDFCEKTINILEYK